MGKTEEQKATVEADKVKEEKSLKVAEGKCWKRVWMKVLKKTGDHLQDVPFKKQFDFAFNPIIPGLFLNSIYPGGANLPPPIKCPIMGGRFQN